MRPFGSHKQPAAPKASPRTWSRPLRQRPIGHERSRPSSRPARKVAGAAAAVAAASAGLALSPPVALAAGTKPGTGWARFALFAAGVGLVDVSVDGKSLGDDIAFRDVTNFMPVPAGRQSIVVTAANRPSTSAPLASGEVTVPAAGAITVAAVAALSAAGATKVHGSSRPTAAAHQNLAISLQNYTDDLSQPEAGHSIVRIIDTVPNMRAITAQLTKVETTTTLTVGPVLYGHASPYATVLVGKYDVVIKDGAPTPLVTGKNWPVPPGAVSSVVVVDAPTGPTLEVLVDAVGTSSMPKGGMQTGLGGAARRPLPLARTVGMPAAATAVVLGGGLYMVFRRKSPVSPRQP